MMPSWLASIASPSPGDFAWLDWLVVAAYLALVIAIGILARRRGGRGEFFLAGRSMPMWAVAISVLATSQSAATFVGGPQQSYAGDLTYLAANIGVILAAVLVAVIFIPVYYRRGVVSVYELIGHEYGIVAQRAASAMFMLGRVFASGARLFIVAIPFSLIAFGDLDTRSMVLAILIIAVAATAYTMVGGIRAVIWTDVLQAIIYVATITIALMVLWHQLPETPEKVIDALRSDPSDKLTLLDWRIGPDFRSFVGRKYTIWAIVFGLTLLNLAAFGTDQDLTQRMLTCRSTRAGGWSVIIANLVSLPVVFLFLVMGLLLYAYYEMPHSVGLTVAPTPASDDAGVFVNFILTSMPIGVRGLMLAGLFAAAMSSLDSVLNAMSSTTIADFVRPGGNMDDAARAQLERRLARRLVVAWAAVLAAFACFCIWWRNERGDTLIDFALSVMVFAYAGMLAVFLTATLTRRGNTLSVLFALAVGFVIVLLMQDPIWPWWTALAGINPPLRAPPEEPRLLIAFPWQMLLATTISFGVCCLGRRDHRASP